MLGQRAIREDRDPHLATTLDVTRHGDTGGLDLTVGHIDNPARLKAVKRDIARMYTVLRERELGISQAPAATETKAEEK